MEIIEKEETRRITGPLERNESKVSPLQWEGSTCKTSISKYPMQVLPGVSKGVHAIASMMLSLQQVGNEAVQSVSTVYRNQGTHQLWDEINLTFNSVIYNDQMSTSFKESRGWLAQMSDDQRSHSQWEGSHLSPTDPRSILSAMAHPHLMSRMTSSLHMISPLWPGHWLTKTQGFSPSKMLEKGLSVETACITLQLHNWASLAHPIWAQEHITGLPSVYWVLQSPGQRVLQPIFCWVFPNIVNFLFNSSVLLRSHNSPSIQGASALSQMWALPSSSLFVLYWKRHLKD